jgi:hypothetical protein
MSQDNRAQHAPSRITRGAAPTGRLTQSNYRTRAMEALRRDFKDRCAYSQRHTFFTGLSNMDVDHFNPRFYGDRRHQYDNLMWCTHICNVAKSDKWPSKEQERKGLRFLNPCEEWDYGDHIAENPITHELIGKTPAGRYHIRMLRLNDDSFVWERKTRAEFLKELDSPKLLLGSFEEVRSKIADLRRQIEIFIPPIPYELVLQAN